MSRRIALVTTTIHVPTVLEQYLAQFELHGHREVLVVVVGDLKTPPETASWLAGLDPRGQEIVFLSVEAQRRFLHRFPDLDRLLPWNSIQRRNLGYVYAALEGAGLIVTIDDDNAVAEEDFLGAHQVAGTVMEVDVLSAASGWYNVCDDLVAEPPGRVLHRGYPQSERHDRPETAVTRRRVPVAVNVGLWLGDPDVDAVSRLVTPVEVVASRRSERLALAPGTWCPFNSQNTAFDVRTLPCMYLVVMGPRYRGMAIGRYDDIWMSYFARRIFDHLGELVAYGPPLVVQRRNEHDVLEDLAGELPGMMLTGMLTAALRRLELRETTHLGCYLELIDALRSHFSRPGVCGDEERRFFGEVLSGMEIWAGVCAEVGG